MVSSLVSILVDNVTEHLSMVWVELTLAIFAAIAYFATTSGYLNVGEGKKAPLKAPPMKAPPTKAAAAPCEMRKTAGAEPAATSVAQLAAQALKQGNICESIALILQLPETMAGSMPPNLAMRLLREAASVQRLNDILSDLLNLKGKITAAPLEMVITEAAQNKEFAVCRQLRIISDRLLIPKSQRTFEALARTYASEVVALQELVEEVHVAAFRTPLPLAFARIVLEGCVVMKEMTLANEVLDKVSPSDAPVLRKVIQQVMRPASTGPPGLANSSDENSPRDTLSDEVGDVMASGSSNGNSAPRDVALRANDIRSCGRNGDLTGAIKVYERLVEHSDHVLILNSILDACTECKDMDKAFEYFDRARESRLADCVTYNTMIKGCIANGQEGKAKSLLMEISQKGLTPTRASFHGLLNARVNAKDFTAAWRLVSEMQASGTSPNAVTCSILLKGKLNSAQEVSRVLALIDAMEEPMDEVLFLSVVEACIRTGRLDSLSRQMGKFMRQSASGGLSAPTYGSMIKAYGHARDVKRVWDLWNQMGEHKVQPTSVTLGCMVEALVANGCTGDAWKLTQKVWADENTRALVNTVIYSSILKGFANAQNTEKVMTLYEEMRAHAIQPNTITFNTILNAFAKGGTMQRVPTLLEDMAAATPPVELDIVSYSTIVKGYCACGQLDRALKVVQDMKTRGKHTPDEVMYNSLLGGCAKEHRPDEALELLNDMRKSGVPPSNYTLSMLVKLMGRCRRINQAFTMLEDISKEYGLKINIQVYTCLIQGCFNSWQAQKAISLHEKIIQEGLTPDSMTYTVLVRGCLQSNLVEEAVKMVKYAYGKAPGQSSRAAAPGLNAGCTDELFASLNSSGSEKAKTLLADLAECQIKPAGPGMKQQPQKTSHAGSTGSSWRQQRA